MDNHEEKIIDQNMKKVMEILEVEKEQARTQGMSEAEHKAIIRNATKKHLINTMMYSEN